MLSPERLQRLQRHAERLRQRPLRALCADSVRARDWSLSVGPLYFNYARQDLDDAAMAELIELAVISDVKAALRRQFDGEIVNVSEDRAVLHTALRSDVGEGDVARAARTQALAALARMRELAREVVDSDITDIVHVGIGGSDLGPRLLVNALRRPDARFRVHFIANVDAHEAQRVLAGLDPAHTAGVLVSKSFGTRETLLNGALLRDWLGATERLFAVSANLDRVADFGIPADRVLPIRDWVGGRFSLWSAVGFSALLALGGDVFDELLNGAALMDRHVADAEPAANMAVLHALLALWNRNARGTTSEAVIAYDQRLAQVPAYLQQLRMESLGKSVDRDGVPLPYATAPVTWGGAGSSTQHSFFQALHQGSERLPLEFIGVCRPDHDHLEQHAVLLANLLAQAEALANGQSSDDPQRHYPGGTPSSMLLLDSLTPEALGTLLALYEHSTAVLGHLWGVNAFDQWGVERGKVVASRLEPAVRGDAADDIDDPVTRALLQSFRRD
ncbi:MAG: glucose-6-phosphate isomerase [Xanthomonadales bacterium]|nr:glucose-6-phosphate isomerase [Xanthomonadales bacterium]